MITPSYPPNTRVRPGYVAYELTILACLLTYTCIIIGSDTTDYVARNEKEAHRRLRCDKPSTSWKDHVECPRSTIGSIPWDDHAILI